MKKTTSNGSDGYIRGRRRRRFGEKRNWRLDPKSWDASLQNDVDISIHFMFEMNYKDIQARLRQKYVNRVLAKVASSKK